MGELLGELGETVQTVLKAEKPKDSVVRGQSPHPGVQIIVRPGKEGLRYYARWADPKLSRPVTMLDSNGVPLIDKRNGRPRVRVKQVREEQCLDTLGLHSAKKREIWCKAKARDLMVQVAAIKCGETVTEETPLPTALEGYFEAKESELQPTTLIAYRQGTRPFAAWCATNGVAFIESVTPALLAQYREWFVGRPAHVPMRGTRVGRGTRKEGSRRKSAAQENKCLNSLRVVLSQLRREGKLPNVVSDDIVDSLRFVKRERPKRSFLNAEQVAALLESAAMHDEAGHDAIAPFTATCLLTGMRFNELAELTWEEVDLKAQEIQLSAKRTKTSMERTVRLDKLPTLFEWLSRTPMPKRKGRVFPHITFAIARMARARLMEKFQAPAFTWHRLRATCGTYSVCSSLYGRGSEHETARQLGHSIQVAQAHYTGRAKDCLTDAPSLEAAMRCVDGFKSCFGS